MAVAAFYRDTFVNRLKMMTSLNTTTQLMFLRDVMMTTTMYVLYNISVFVIINYFNMGTLLIV